MLRSQWQIPCTFDCHSSGLFLRDRMCGRTCHGPKRMLWRIQTFSLIPPMLRSPVPMFLVLPLPNLPACVPISCEVWRSFPGPFLASDYCCSVAFFPAISFGCLPYSAGPSLFVALPLHCPHNAFLPAHLMANNRAYCERPLSCVV